MYIGKESLLQFPPGPCAYYLGCQVLLSLLQKAAIPPHHTLPHHTPLHHPSPTILFTRCATGHNHTLQGRATGGPAHDSLLRICIWFSFPSVGLVSDRDEIS